MNTSLSPLKLLATEHLSAYLYQGLTKQLPQRINPFRIESLLLPLNPPDAIHIRLRYITHTLFEDTSLGKKPMVSPKKKRPSVGDFFPSDSLLGQNAFLWVRSEAGFLPATSKISSSSQVLSRAFWGQNP